MLFQVLIEPAVGDERHEVVSGETASELWPTFSAELVKSVAEELIEDVAMDAFRTLELLPSPDCLRAFDLGLLIEKWKKAPPEIVAGLHRFHSFVVGIRCLGRPSVISNLLQSHHRHMLPHYANARHISERRPVAGAVVARRF